MKLRTWLLSLMSLSIFCGTAMAAPVNVNKADSSEISAALTGIGMVKAQRIADFCQKNSCQKPEDLLGVKGVGAKTLEKISEDLRFSDAQ